MPGYKNFSFKISPLAEFVLYGYRLAVFKQTEYKNQFGNIQLTGKLNLFSLQTTK